MITRFITLVQTGAVWRILGNFLADIYLGITSAISWYFVNTAKAVKRLYSNMWNSYFFQSFFGLIVSIIAGAVISAYLTSPQSIVGFAIAWAGIALLLFIPATSLFRVVFWIIRMVTQGHAKLKESQAKRKNKSKQYVLQNQLGFNDDTSDGVISQLHEDVEMTYEDLI